MEQYLSLLRDVLRRGKKKKQRAVLSDGSKPDILSLFGIGHFEFDMSRGRFPLLTTKKMYFNIVATELAWFLRGETNVRYLMDRNVKVWNDWADDRGELGNVYGALWRKYPAGSEIVLDTLKNEFLPETMRPRTVDQIFNLVADIQTVCSDPHASCGRRLILCNWLVDPERRPPKAPPACHTLAQFNVLDGKLDCHVYMRSADIFLGVPYNIASYALLVRVLCWVFQHRLEPGVLSFSFGDLHIYENHMDQVQEQLSRRPLDLPKVRWNASIPLPDPGSFQPECVELVDYNSHPALKGEIAV